MSANQKRKLWCVWDNTDDRIVAIDQPADVCAVLMGIGRGSFYSLKARMKSCPDAERKWTIISSKDIKED